MLTKPISFNHAQQHPIALTGRCKLFVQGQEDEVPVITCLRLIIYLARKRIPHEVFYEDGRLLLRHNGEKTIESDAAFEDVVVIFSEFLLEEQREGYRLYEEAVTQRSAQAASGS